VSVAIGFYRSATFPEIPIDRQIFQPKIASLLLHSCATIPDQFLQKLLSIATPNSGNIQGIFGG
jgi:hypothetical protein